MKRRRFVDTFAGTRRPAIRIIAAIAIGFALSGVHNAIAQTRELSSEGVLLDGVAAVVNDGVVLKSELEAETARIVKRLEAQNTPVPPMAQLLPQVLEKLVIQRIQLQRAERIGIRISDETLNQALASIAQRNGVALSDLPAVLKKEDIDYSTYRAELRNELAIEQLRQRDVVARINVTPRELEDYLERQQGRRFDDQEFKLSQILIAIPTNATQQQINAAEQKIEEIYQQVLAGKSFRELAIANSNGQHALEGGNLGWRKGSELPTLFADIVPGMQPGQVSEPIRSSSGFHLVRLDDRRGGGPIMEDQIHVRHILMTTNEIMDDAAVRQKLSELRAQIIGGDDFSAVAKVVSEDPGSAIEGGDMGWVNPQVFVPEFREVCEKLPIGEISQPFKTPFGWHIVEVLGRRTKDTTEEVARQQALAAIRNSKLGEETELWTRRLRGEAFVEYRL